MSGFSFVITTQPTIIVTLTFTSCLWHGIQGPRLYPELEWGTLKPMKSSLCEMCVCGHICEICKVYPCEKYSHSCLVGWSTSLMRCLLNTYHCIPRTFCVRMLSLPVVSSSLWPIDCSPPGSSVHGIPQAGILEQVAISFSRRSPQPRDQTRVSLVSCTGWWIL